MRPTAPITVAFLCAGLWPGLARAQQPPPPKPAVDVVIERSRGDEWQVVNPRTVFAANDEIRFRFRSSSPGFLYVLNQTATGAHMWLYPSPQAGANNKIEANREYLIPATEGVFRIPPTPGNDTVYWMVARESLGELPPAIQPLLP
ncbi:MAG: DUF4384 domain-containing protein, partial [Acidobacteriota bacterium]|nr:DUF4384 domain-containing protein [Acidobacteriota bacterium]